MRYHFFIVILLVLIKFAWSDCLSETTVSICGTLGETTSTVLKQHDIDVTSAKTRTLLSFDDKEEGLAALSEAALHCELRRQIAELNLANAQTTKTVDGLPYRKQSVVLLSDGTAVIVQNQGDFNWVYDPTHPDARREGPKAGYVAKPNVNSKEEEDEIRQMEAEIFVIRQIAEKVDPTIIIPKRPNLDNSKAPKFNCPRWRQITIHWSNNRFKPQLPDNGIFSGLGLVDHYRTVSPLAQSNATSEGQTAVAMCINSLTGASITDLDIDAHYGFQLLRALKNESKPAGYDWFDAGNINEDSKSFIKETLDQQLPIILALNGPEFSPSGRGHIITLVSYDDDEFCYADPADGNLKTTTWQSFIEAPSHPDGNFIFLPKKLDDSGFAISHENFFPFEFFKLKPVQTLEGLSEPTDVSNAIFALRDIKFQGEGSKRTLYVDDEQKLLHATLTALTCCRILRERVDTTIELLLAPPQEQGSKLFSSLAEAMYKDLCSRTDLEKERQERNDLIAEESRLIALICELDPTATLIEDYHDPFQHDCLACPDQEVVDLGQIIALRDRAKRVVGEDGSL